MRVSATWLDSFRHYLADHITLDQLLATIRKTEEPNAKMLAGIAWHKCLEQWEDLDHDKPFLEMDGHLFAVGFDAELYLPPTREVKLVKPYPELDSELVGVCDALDGRECWDHKLTGQFDAERYADAIQWRAYLTMFGCDKFTYNAFTGTQDKSDPRLWRVRSLDQVSFYRYPGMEEEVKDWLVRFLDFATVYA